MYLNTYIITALVLTSSAFAGQFKLIQKTDAFNRGCNLKIENVCGCNKDISINKAWPCTKLPNVWTGGKVCGGKWQLNTKDKRHTVRFEKKGCNEGCNLNSMKGLVENDVNPRKSGANCGGIRY
ncbi:MAG: hypothetical protein L6R36_001253 [Xanthoria steineri]|nr:MAG: hypothetical protein L6R36_001253 [Xanthoria steineri]